MTDYKRTKEQAKARGICVGSNGRRKSDRISARKNEKQQSGEVKKLQHQLRENELNGARKGIKN